MRGVTIMKKGIIKGINRGANQEGWSMQEFRWNLSTCQGWRGTT